MPLTYVFEAFLIGMAVAAIFGPTSMLFVQKTLKIGAGGAIAVGLGAAFADAIYGLVAGAGLSAITHFLMGKITILKIMGGGFLLYLAGKECLQKQISATAADITSSKNLWRLCGQTFLLTLTGPVTILFFISVFASIGGKEISILESLLMVLGIFLGSVVWWIFLGSLVLILRTRLSQLWLNRTRYFSATILGGFGLWTLYSAIVR